MDLSLTEEERAIRDWVRTFVEREVMPLEPDVLRRERGGEPGLSRNQLRELQAKARGAGFWVSLPRWTTAAWVSARSWRR